MKTLINFFFKKIVNIFLDEISNFKYKKIIESEDKQTICATNVNLKKDFFFNQFLENGYTILNNYASDQEIENLNKDLNFNKKKINWEFSNIIVNPRTVVDKILQDKKIIDLLRNYLGKDAKLDSIEANKYSTNPEKVSSSEMWHYDIVGRRIKIFLFLNDCDLIFTEYVDGTNKILHKNFTTRKSRKSDNYISKKFNKISKIFPKKGSLFIFDTNGFHRGVYRSGNTHNVSNRQTLQFEFSSKFKSDKLFSIGCNSIGVRNIFLSKKCDFADYLIDRNYLSELNSEEIIFYDQEYSSL